MNAHPTPVPPENRGGPDFLPGTGADSIGDTRFEDRIEAARGGSSAAMGELFEGCRNYLLLIASVTVKQGLHAKVGASDLVQETFVEAQRNLERFEGKTEEELLRWMTRILEHRIGNTLKRYLGTSRRDVKRECGWQQIGGGDLPAVKDNSPSAVLQSKEEFDRFQQALASLPYEHQEVIRLRIAQNLPFEEIGRRMGRSAAAVQMLFVRIVVRLKKLVASHHDRPYKSK